MEDSVSAVVVVIIAFLVFAFFAMLIVMSAREGGENLTRRTRMRLDVSKTVVREVERLLVEDERVPFLSQDRRELLQGLVEKYHRLD
jgi:hypothetical protein